MPLQVWHPYTTNVQKLTNLVLEQYITKSSMDFHISLNIVKKNWNVNLKPFMFTNFQIFMNADVPYELYSGLTYYYPVEMRND